MAITSLKTYHKCNHLDNCVVTTTRDKTKGKAGKTNIMVKKMISKAKAMWLFAKSDRWISIGNIK